MAVINDGEWTFLSKEDETFRGEVSLSAGEAQVAARFPGDESYHWLLEYAVL